MSDRGATDVLVGFGVGLLVGAVAGVLLAPATGEETRRRIGDFTRDTADKAKEKAGGAGEFLKEQAGRLGSAIQEGKEAYQRAATKG